MAQLGALQAENDALRNAGDLYGAQKHAEEHSPKLMELSAIDDEIGKRRENLSASLKNGNYLTDTAPMESFDFSEDGIKNKTSQALSALFGEPVDVTKGADGVSRVKLSFFQPDKQEVILAQQYGEKNVRNQNIGGKRHTFVFEGGSWKPVNPMGAEIGDLSAFPGEIFPMATGIAGSIAGAGATATPFGAAVGGAAGYAAGGTLQDALMSAVFNVNYDFAESLGKRSMEGLAGAAIEYPMGKMVAGPIAKRAARKNSRDTLLDVYRREEDFLNSEGFGIRIAGFASSGSEKSARRVAAAQRRPLSTMGRDYNAAMERMEALKTEIPAPDKAAQLYQSGLRNLQHSMEQTANIIGAFNKEAADAINRDYRQRLGKLVRPEQGGERISIGERLQQAMQAAESTANDIKNQTYKAFHEKASQNGVSVDPIKFAESVEKEYLKKHRRNPEVDGVLRRIRERPENEKKLQEVLAKIPTAATNDEKRALIKQARELKQNAGPLDSISLHNYVREFKQAHPADLLATGPQKEAAGWASSAADRYMKNAFERAGLGSDWAQATAVYDNRMFLERQQLGGILKETFGRADLTPSQFVDKAISDPRITTDLLGEIRRNVPAQYDSFRTGLQEAYLRKIGLDSPDSIGKNGFNFDKDQVMALYGFDSMGRPSPANGKRMVGMLESLSKDAKKYRVDISKLKIEDIDALRGTLSDKQFGIAKTAILKRAKAEREAEILKNNALMKTAMNGHPVAVQSHEFPAAMWNAPTRDIAKVFGKFGPTGQKTLRGDFAEYLFARYPANGKYGPNGNMLWDGEKLLLDIAERPAIEANMRLVLGDQFTNRVLSSSRLMKSIEGSQVGGAQTKARGLITNHGITAYLGTDKMIEKFADRWHAALYRAGNHPLLGKTAKDVTDFAYAEEYAKSIAKVSTVTSGITALTMTGRHDPNWGAYLGETFGVMPDETKRREKFGDERHEGLAPFIGGGFAK